MSDISLNDHAINLANLHAKIQGKKETTDEEMFNKVISALGISYIDNAPKTFEDLDDETKKEFIDLMLREIHDLTREPDKISKEALDHFKKDYGEKGEKHMEKLVADNKSLTRFKEIQKSFAHSEKKDKG